MVTTSHALEVRLYLLTLLNYSWRSSAIAAFSLVSSLQAHTTSTDARGAADQLEQTLRRACWKATTLSVILNGRNGGEGEGGAAAAGYPDRTVESVSPGLGARRRECQGLCGSPSSIPLIFPALIAAGLSPSHARRTTGSGCCCITCSFWTIRTCKMPG